MARRTSGVCHLQLEFSQDSELGSSETHFVQSLPNGFLKNSLLFQMVETVPDKI